MGRRIKEPAAVHREKIASAAGGLFSRKGLEAATMDDIAKAAGYSKATLYVYFTSKEEIVAYLVLKSMKLLHQTISEAVYGSDSVRDKYFRICRALAAYQEEYPLYFSIALGKIKVDVEEGTCLPVEKETYVVGEQINGELAAFLCEGIGAGEFQPELPILPTVFLFWALLGGLIRMAADKEAYFEKALNMSGRQFLEFGFERLYVLIQAGPELED